MTTRIDVKRLTNLARRRRVLAVVRRVRHATFADPADY